MATKQRSCLGCGHAENNHIQGVGLCLVKSCRLCLIFRPNERATCTVRVSDDSFIGFHHCDAPGELKPELGAGHAVCIAHQLDPSFTIRDYHGATVLAVAS